MKKIKLYEEFIDEAGSFGPQHADVSGKLLKPKKGKWMKLKPRKHR